MIVKFRRGPNAGKFLDLPDSSHTLRIVVREPAYMTSFDPFDYPSDPLVSAPVKEGTYVRTNQVTKKGVPIYEWMGFYGEVVG